MKKIIQITAPKASATARLVAIAIAKTGNFPQLIEQQNSNPSNNMALALNVASLKFLQEFDVVVEGTSILSINIYASNQVGKIYSPPFTVKASDIEQENLGKVLWQKDLLDALPKPLNQPCDKADFTIETGGSVFDGTSYKQIALSGTISHDWQHQNTAEQFFYADGPLALLPLMGNRSFFIWTRPTKQAQILLSLANENFCKFLGEHLPNNKQNFMVEGKILSHPLRFHFASNWVRGDKLLLGNAAHVPHPLAGQGWNICVEDIKTLFELIENYQKLGLEVFSPTMLREYQNSRQARSGALTRLIHQLAKHNFLSNPIGAAALDFLSLSDKLKKVFANAGAGTFHNFIASSTNKIGTPSSTL